MSLKKTLMKKTLLIAIVFFSVGTLANADTFTVYATSAAQNASDFIQWSQLGPAVTQFGTPQFVFTGDGNLAVVGNIDFSPFVRVDQGNGWNGNFANGENLVWTGNANGLGGEGPFALVLQTPALSFGFGIETAQTGPFMATVEAYGQNGDPLFSDTFNGVSGGAIGTGSELFVGMGDTAGANIGSILISTSSPNGAVNNFAINDPGFTYATPEPGSMALLGSALLGAVGMLRRKLLN